MVAEEGVHTLGNPCPVVDKETGTIWLPFCKNNQQIFLIKSTDDGTTWSEPVEITRQVKDSEWSYLGTGPGHGIQLKSGRLLIPCWGDASPGPVNWKTPNWNQLQFSFVAFSDDHGVTWERGETPTQDASDESEAVETVDGGLYLNMRSRQKRHRRGFAWSRDDGKTWSDVQYDSTLPEPSCDGGLVRFTDQGDFQKNRVLLSPGQHQWAISPDRQSQLR